MVTPNLSFTPDGQPRGRRAPVHAASRASTRTHSSSSRPGRVRTQTKCGASPATVSSSSSIWLGKRLTPRTIIMSSLRPVMRSIRRIGRLRPGSSRVRSRVRYRTTGIACLVSEVKTSSPFAPSGSTSPVSGSTISG